MKHFSTRGENLKKKFHNSSTSTTPIGYHPVLDFRLKKLVKFLRFGGECEEHVKKKLGNKFKSCLITPSFLITDTTKRETHITELYFALLDQRTHVPVSANYLRRIGSKLGEMVEKHSEVLRMYFHCKYPRGMTTGEFSVFLRECLGVRFRLREFQTVDTTTSSNDLELLAFRFDDYNNPFQKKIEGPPLSLEHKTVSLVSPAKIDPDDEREVGEEAIQLQDRIGIERYQRLLFNMWNACVDFFVYTIPMALEAEEQNEDNNHVPLFLQNGGEREKEQLLALLAAKKRRVVCQGKLRGCVERFAVSAERRAVERRLSKQAFRRLMEEEEEEVKKKKKVKSEGKVDGYSKRGRRKKKKKKKRGKRKRK